tara:strand:+ start:2067 stop:2393 length:327 start_codon:yes stop_codon:yes gene_type:complete
MDYEEIKFSLEDFDKYREELLEGNMWGDNSFSIHESDMVNSPAHYTRGRYEAIDVIEDAIETAPDPVLGMLQGQVLKYVLRLWHKSNCTEDARKAEWYLRRLIDKLSE